MNIWLINNYNMLPEHGHLNRNYYLAKYLKRHGHEPVCFVGSHPHNSNLQLIDGKERYKIYQNHPFPWVLIKTRNYEGSRIQRVLAMFEFYLNMLKSARHFDRPDAIVGSSAHPLAALLAIQLGKKYNCKKIVEIRDLWPESIVAYGIASRNNPLVKLLYWFEHYLYKHADKVIFTMENAEKYLEERNLTDILYSNKFFYLNNGVDLEEFNLNKTKWQLDDADLLNNDFFNVVYTGSIRKVNNLGLVLEAAKIIKSEKVRFLIWGSGDELDLLKAKVKSEKINNVVFKGSVDKKYIPFITTNADLNYMHNAPSPVLKYGLSANKLFDYAAAGKPIFTDFECGMNPSEKYGAGVSLSDPTPEKIANIIDYFSQMNHDEYLEYCEKALVLANDYSFDNLSKKLVTIVAN